MIRKATRQGVRPIISIYSESGCGKTYSSLLLARGFVGHSGRIVLADSESGRGELYADVPEIGGYDVLPIEPPFAPSKYISVIKEIEESGASIGIIDSGSHEWEGIGGVLDMACENEHRSGKPGLHNWKGPKLEHAKFMLTLLQAKIPFIVCLRAKFKSRQIKDNGKTQIVKDDFTTPIQADDFIFESTCHGEVMPNHHFRLTKCSHPDLRKCFPSDGPITVKHGELLAQWCAAPGANLKADLPEAMAFRAKIAADGTTPKKNPAKAKLWLITKEIHGGDTGKLEDWLKRQKIIRDEIRLADIPESDWAAIMDKAEIAISDIVP